MIVYRGRTGAQNSSSITAGAVRGSQQSPKQAATIQIFKPKPLGAKKTRPGTTATSRAKLLD